MSTIKTWKQLLNDRIGDMQITTNDDVRLAMQDHIDAVTEALKAAQLFAQEETHFAIQHQFVLIKQRDDFRAERDALQAKLSAIEAQEPVMHQVFVDKWRTVDESTFNNYAEQDRRALYAAPVAPAQPVNELVEALEDARDVLYQVAHGNTACGKDAECVGGLIATALANAKAARPLTKEQVQPAQWTAGAKMPCGAVVTNVYDAYEAGKKAALLQSNAERVPLSEERIFNLYCESDALIDTDAANLCKFARAIEAEITKGQQ